MLVTKRTQGRPPRDSGINGRDKLIEATRIYLQTNRKMSLTRTEIAQGCGVTPALISYYFKDKNSLLDAVTKPLIKAYSTRIHAITRSANPLPHNARNTVHLLIEMNVDNAFLVDHMLGGFASNKLDADDRRVFDEIHLAIAELVTKLVDAGLWRSSDPLLTEVALWGMCRAFGEAIRVRLADPACADRRDVLIAAKVDYVCAAFAPERSAIPALAIAPVD